MKPSVTATDAVVAAAVGCARCWLLLVAAAADV